MVVCLKTFCTHFHWKVSKEHCCRCGKNTAHYRAKCSDDRHTSFNSSVQENHELSCLPAMITASFVHLEQSWECLHTQPPSHEQEHRVHISAAVVEATLLWGPSAWFYAIQYWYQQWFKTEYHGGHKGRNKEYIHKCDGYPNHCLKQYEGRHNSNHR